MKILITNDDGIQAPGLQSLIRIARESGDTELAEPLDLGARVRDLRKSRNWTLEQAAKQAGLARSTLSKIENGQMSPTYDALKKLAVGLEISVPQLFTQPQRDQINGRMAVTRSRRSRWSRTPASRCGPAGGTRPSL